MLIQLCPEVSTSFLEFLEATLDPETPLQLLGGAVRGLCVPFAYVSLKRMAPSHGIGGLSGFKGAGIPYRG